MQNSSFTYFSFFLTKMTVKIFLKQPKSTKFDMGFRMVYELLHLDEKKFWSIFYLRWVQNQKNLKKINWFCNDNSYTIRKPMSNLVDGQL